MSTPTEIPFAFFFLMLAGLGTLATLMVVLAGLIINRIIFGSRVSLYVSENTNGLFTSYLLGLLTTTLVFVFSWNPLLIPAVNFVVASLQVVVVTCRADKTRR